MNPISEAVTKFQGGQAALARELGISPQAVNQWVTGRRPVPVRWALQIERLTGISRYDLRPDVFGDAPISHDGERRVAGGLT